MDFKTGIMFKANVTFEVSIDICGCSYLLIYGEHINGNFCCVPEWGWGCEMSEPDDIACNRDKLMTCGASKNVAETLARAIKCIAGNT